VLRHKGIRWETFEVFYPRSIPHALTTTLAKIEEAVPGALKKADALDDKEWQTSKRRQRRYVAESPDLLYIGSPHLKRQSERVGDYHVITNIPWRDVPEILRLVCKAAEIECQYLSKFPF
jgi:hypothetical protein